MTVLILLGLALSQPAHGGEEMTANIITQTTSGRWIIQYGSRRLSCEATYLCEDFRDDIYLIPHMNFSRSRELVEYVTRNNQWNDCVVRNCKEY